MRIAVAQMPGVALADWRATLDSVVETIRAAGPPRGPSWWSCPNAHVAGVLPGQQGDLPGSPPVRLPDGQFFLECIAARRGPHCGLHGFVEEQGEHLQRRRLGGRRWKNARRPAQGLPLGLRPRLLRRRR